MKKLPTFAERLRFIREFADLSQYRLAQLTGMSKQEISRLELNGRQDPAWSTVQRLALALGVSTEAFRTIVALEPPPLKRGRGRPRLL